MDFENVEMVDGDHYSSEDLLDITPSYFMLGKFPVDKNSTYTMYATSAPYTGAITLDYFLMVQASDKLLKEVFGGEDYLNNKTLRLVAINDNGEYLAVTPFGFLGWINKDDFSIINYHKANLTIN